MNWFIIASGLLAAFTVWVHLVLGGKAIARPLLASGLDEVVKLTLYACWHLVSVSLVLSSFGLLAHGIGVIGPSPSLIAFVSVSWLFFGIVFLVVTLWVARPRSLFRFPQWVLLLPVGVLGLLGLL